VNECFNEGVKTQNEPPKPAASHSEAEKGQKREKGAKRKEKDKKQAQKR